jgi:hypothetical protein
LNPSDIESIDILKDAASAIWISSSGFSHTVKGKGLPAKLAMITIMEFKTHTKLGSIKCSRVHVYHG